MRKFFTLALVLGLVVAACSGSSDETTTTSTADDAATTSSPTEETATTAAPDPTTTTAAEATTTAAEATGGGGSDCLVGTWVLDSEGFMENFSSIFAEAGMPDAEVTSLGGTFTVDLGADGSLNSTRDAWGFNIVTSETTVVIEVSGTETGTWSADDTTLEVTTDTSDLAVNTSIEVDGEVIPVPDDQIPVDAPPGIATNSDYTCSGDVLTLSNAGVESVLNRG